MAVQEQEYEELKRKAEEIVEELVVKARTQAADAGVVINAEPIVVEREARVEWDSVTRKYIAYAAVKFYLPFYIVEVRKYVDDGDVTVIIDHAIQVDNSCICDEG